METLRHAFAGLCAGGFMLVLAIAVYFLVNDVLGTLLGVASLFTCGAYWLKQARPPARLAGYHRWWAAW